MSRFAFARQSLFVLAASHGGSACLAVMTGVLQRRLNSQGDEYALFNSLRLAMTQAMIPLLGLQFLFAQMAAKRAAAQSGDPLSGAVRSVLKSSIALWILVGAACFLARGWIVSAYKLPDASILNWMILAGWSMAATPLFLGLLQGRQKFSHFLAGKILYDSMLLAGVAGALFFLSPSASSAMSGLCIGAAISCAIAAWLSRADWLEAPGRFEFRSFAKNMIPMTIGLGVTQFMISEDLLLVQRFFETGRDDYSAGRQVGLMAYYLMLPVTVVLFPKVVESHARAEKNSAFNQALLGAAAVSISAAAALTLFPKLPLWVLSSDKFLSASPYVAKFAWALVPLALFTILINNLLALERYKAVPWLLAVVIGYSAAIRLHHPDMNAVILWLGVFSTLLLAVAAWFTWKD